MSRPPRFGRWPLWLVSAAVSGLARYTAPVYGLLGLLRGVAVVGLSRNRPRSGSWR